MIALSNIVEKNIEGNKGKDFSKKITANYLKTGGVYRIKLGELNKNCVESLIEGNYKEKPELKDLRTNRLIIDAFDIFKKNIETFIKKTNEKEKFINDIYNYIQNKILTLEYVVSEESPAPKIFLVINDRGKLPTILDKTKSLLVFWSYRYLNNKLNKFINDNFTEIFNNYDHIKDIGEDCNIDYIGKWDRGSLNEDSILEFFYHYFAYYSLEKYKLSNLKYHYDHTSEYIFNNFLKNILQPLEENKKLEEFIEEFLSDFYSFIAYFLKLLKRVENGEKAYIKFLSFLGPHPHIYPLIISLEKESLINDDFLKIIEIFDFRLYKVGTKPRRDLFIEIISKIKINKINNELDIEYIKTKLKELTRWFMPDKVIKETLSNGVYGHDWVKYVIWEYNKYLYNDFNDTDIKIYHRDKNPLEIEHIFPRNHKGKFPYCGFKEKYEYDEYINHFGNLTLLERNLGSSARDLGPKEKAKYYKKSILPETRKLGASISNNGFNKKSLNERTDEIVDLCIKRWPLE
jgi:hypothetical protein